MLVGTLNSRAEASLKKYLTQTLSPFLSPETEASLPLNSTVTHASSASEAFLYEPTILLVKGNATGVSLTVIFPSSEIVRDSDFCTSEPISIVAPILSARYSRENRVSVALRVRLEL